MMVSHRWTLEDHNNMNKSTVILSVIITALLAYIIFFKGSPINEDKYAKQKREIDSLKVEIVVLEKQQNIQDSVIHAHKDSIIALDHEIETKDQKIKDIRKYYGDKIKNNSNLTSAELNSFFADRYKWKTSLYSKPTLYNS